jgi:O-antigen/teichoic acid export membrane protein
MEAGARPAGSLAAPVLGGLRWKAAAQAVDLCTRAVVAVLLARLLGPHELGLAAMAFAFSALGQAFADAAMTTAIVQRRHLTELDRSTAFWMSLAAGALLALLGVAASGLVAAFFAEPRVRALFAVLSAGFVVGALGAVPAALLARALDFRRLELAGIAGSLLGAAVAVAAAAAGAGAAAVVARSLADLSLTTALLWRAVAWRPRLVFSAASLRDLGAFGLDVLGSRLFFYLQRNADNLLVGRFLGASSLGAYALAYNLVLLPFAQLADPLRTVLFPVLAGIQDDRERVAAVWLRATRVLAAVLLPVLLGLVVMAPDFVAVVLGPRWHPAAGPLRVLAVVGGAQSLIAINSVVLTALGHTRALLRFSILTFLLSLLGFALGLKWGLVGVSVGYLAANAIIVPLYLRLTARAVSLSVRRAAAALAGVTKAATATLFCVLAARAGLLAAGTPASVRLAAVTAIGAAAFAALAARHAPELRDELRIARQALAAPGKPTHATTRPAR